MSLPYVVRPQAEEEILDAALYYERERTGLSALFFAAIRETMLRAVETPAACTPVRGVKGLVIRCLSARRFPYYVVFLHEPDRIVFLAVAHRRRRPRDWKDRV